MTIVQVEGGCLGGDLSGDFFSFMNWTRGRQQRESILLLSKSIPTWFSSCMGHTWMHKLPNRLKDQLSQVFVAFDHWEVYVCSFLCVCQTHMFTVSGVKETMSDNRRTEFLFFNYMQLGSIHGWRCWCDIFPLEWRASFTHFKLYLCLITRAAPVWVCAPYSEVQQPAVLLIRLLLVHVLTCTQSDSAVVGCCL